MPAHWAGTACPPDSCLCHPRVGTAQRSPDLCLPVPPCPLPSWSEGQLFLGSAPDVSPQIPSRLALTWDSRPRTSWSPPAADAMGVVATGRAAPGQRPAPECFPKSFLGPVWPPPPSCCPLNPAFLWSGEAPSRWQAWPLFPLAPCYKGHLTDEETEAQGDGETRSKAGIRAPLGRPRA